MSKNKKQNASSGAPMSPETYLRTRARLLPVGVCYKGTNEDDDRAMTIIVTRLHPQGNYTFGAFFLDRWCTGVKDVIWQFNMTPSEFRSLINEFRSEHDNWQEINYIEAHNWVYGVLEFAEEAGIAPHKDFALAQYVLDEDDDKVPLIEYEFGRNGKYFLWETSPLEASKYTIQMDRILGKGNYEVFIDRDWGESWNDLDNNFYDDSEEDAMEFMDYTYQGGDYPKTIKLHHPELRELLGKPSSPSQMRTLTRSNPYPQTLWLRT